MSLLKNLRDKTGKLARRWFVLLGYPQKKDRAIFYRVVFFRAFSCYLRNRKYASVLLCRLMSLRYLSCSSWRMPSWFWLALFQWKADGRSIVPDMHRRCEDLAPSIATAAQFLEIAGLLNLIREYRVAGIFRDKAMERTLLGKPDLLYLKALIDLGRIDEAKSLIERDLIANAHGDFIERSAWYISVLSGERPPPLLRDGKFRLGDERFLQLVQGKSVAVVGPLNNGEGNGAEIDEFDIVVRTNCFTWQNNVQSDKGSRLDVAYYNGEAAALLKRTPEDVPECRFMVLKAFDEELQKRYENLRTLISVDLFFSGSINAIPNVVYDLIRFSPSRIKVFNADLMLSYKYRKGYVDAINFSIAHSLDEALDSFFAHEPAQQFRALHLLWERGLIEGDRVFNSVMALGLTGYLEKLTGRLYETTLGGSGKR